MRPLDLTATPQNSTRAMHDEIERVARLLIGATRDVLETAGHTVTEPMFRLIAERCLADAAERYRLACDQMRERDR